MRKTVHILFFIGSACAFGLALSTVLLSSLPADAAIYRCGDGRYQGSPCKEDVYKPPIKVRVATPEPKRAEEPSPTDAEALTLEATPPAPTAKAAPDPRPFQCQSISAAQQQAIKEAVRFLRIATCMTEQEALNSLRSTPFDRFDESLADGSVISEWVITPPHPRFPNRIKVHKGYVVELQ